jgi:multiple sugar transport system substrate-binding protein
MDMLNAAGINEPPTTWAEFTAAAEKTSDSANGVYGFAMSAIGNEEGTFQFIPWLYGSGATVASVNSPEGIKAFSTLSNLITNGWMSKEVVNWTQGDALNAWAAGKSAMMEMGTWHIANLETDLKDTVTFTYKVAPLPKNEENGAQATVIGGENFGVCSGATEPEACAQFIMYMQSAQGNADWCEVAGKLPVRSDAVPLKSFWTADERFKVFNDSMAFAVPRGPHESWPTISEALYTAEQSALLGQMSPADAAAQAAAVIDPILAETPLPYQA